MNNFAGFPSNIFIFTINYWCIRTSCDTSESRARRRRCTFSWSTYPEDPSRRWCRDSASLRKTSFACTLVKFSSDWRTCTLNASCTAILRVQTFSWKRAVESSSPISAWPRCSRASPSENHSRVARVGWRPKSFGSKTWDSSRTFGASDARCTKWPPARRLGATAARKCKSSSKSHPRARSRRFRSIFPPRGRVSYASACKETPGGVRRRSRFWKSYSYSTRIDQTSNRAFRVCSTTRGPRP